MAKTTTDEILERLNEEGTDLFALLYECSDAKSERLWTENSVMHRAFGRRLVSFGHPTRAYELVREGLVHHPDDQELKFISALALARGRNIHRAQQILDTLLKSRIRNKDLRVEILSLAGRLVKDCYERANSASEQKRFAAGSAKFYERAYLATSAPFPGINAATMSILAGQHRKGRRIAREVIRNAGATTKQRRQQNDYWLSATLAEANLILGHTSESIQWYSKAIQGAGKHLGDIASMKRNVLLLKPFVDAAQILKLFQLGSVIIFSGHMIDHPDRSTLHGLPPRFPPEKRLEELVRSKIEERLDSQNAAVGYSSVACGSDILFAEVMLERSAELHLVLPFDREDFLNVSVDFGCRKRLTWRKRFEHVLEQATEVHFSTHGKYLHDDSLFNFVNSFMQGLTIIRGAELGVEPAGLVVMDNKSLKQAGGTAQFLESWQNSGHKAEVIDLAALRGDSSAQRSAGVRAASTGKKTAPLKTSISKSHDRVQRSVKTMLFADVKNFSQLTDEQAPSFFVLFLDEVSNVIRESRKRPCLQNTWGDGLFLVFDHVVDAADFSVRLLKRIEGLNFAKVGLPDDTTVRIGLHSGPVYPSKNPVTNRRDFFGSQVNRAARIEPVTTPGCAFASEQFAALLSMQPNHDFICEYVGVENLAKNFDRCALYRLWKR